MEADVDDPDLTPRGTLILPLVGSDEFSGGQYVTRHRIQQALFVEAARDNQLRVQGIEFEVVVMRSETCRRLGSAVSGRSP